LQAGGHRFDPDRLHQFKNDTPEMKTTVPASAGFAGFARFFDIVNGFLIDAVAHGVQLSRAGRAPCGTYRCNNLAEIIVRTDAAG
jgi:hypothetical protein